MPEKLLVIDDDVLWCDSLKTRLEMTGFQVEVAYDVISGLQKAYATHPDVILLDLMLPGIDGRQACNRLREMSDVPIIILTALNSPEHMVECLNLGADDYVVKTVTTQELVARIRAVLRRTTGLTQKGPTYETGKDVIFAHNGVIIDLPKRQITVNGKQVKLSPKEFRLLSLLVKHQGRVLPHEFLLTQVWGPEYKSDMVSLRLYIGYLRRKLEKDPSQPNLIQSEWGIGYRFA